MKLLKVFIVVLLTLKAFGVEAKLYSIANANITLYQIDKKGFHKIWQGFSKGGKSLKDIGSFEINSSLIKNDKFYLLSAKGGRSFDANFDGKIDTVPIKNKGILNAIFKGSDILNIKKFYISFASQILYEKARIKAKYRFNPKTLEAFLNNQAKTILKKDINGDKKIDNKDILRFLPTRDVLKLRKIYTINLPKITKLALQKRAILLNISPVIDSIDIKKFHFPKQKVQEENIEQKQIKNLLYAKILNKYGKYNDDFKVAPMQLYYGNTRLLAVLSPDEWNNVIYYALFDISKDMIKLLDTTQKGEIHNGFAFNEDLFYKNYLLTDRGIYGTFLYKIDKNKIHKEFVFNKERALAETFKKGFLNDKLIYLENLKHTKINIIDITNPLKLFVVDEFSKCADIDEMTMKGNKIFFTSYNDGFYAFKFEKNRLKKIGFFEDEALNKFALNKDATKALLYSEDTENTYLIDLKTFKLIKEKDDVEDMPKLPKGFYWVGKEPIPNIDEKLYSAYNFCVPFALKNNFAFFVCNPYGLIVLDIGEEP